MYNPYAPPSTLVGYIQFDFIFNFESRKKMKKTISLISIMACMLLLAACDNYLDIQPNR